MRVVTFEGPSPSEEGIKSYRRGLSESEIIDHCQETPKTLSTVRYAYAKRSAIAPGNLMDMRFSGVDRYGSF